MDDAKNFLLGVMQTLKDRFGNPLISSIVISWCLWNSQLLIILVSTGDGGWKSKLDYINHTLYPSGFDRILDFLVAPLVFSVIWIYLLPNLLSTVAIHHEKTFNKNRNNLLNEMGNRPISDSDRKMLLETMLKEKNSFLKQKEDLSASYTADQVTIARLSEQITNSTEELAKTNEKIKTLSKEHQDSVDREQTLKTKLTPLTQVVDFNKIDKNLAIDLIERISPGKSLKILPNTDDIVNNRYLETRYPITPKISIKTNSDGKLLEKDAIYDQDMIASLLLLRSDSYKTGTYTEFNETIYQRLKEVGVKNLNNTMNNLYAMNLITSVGERGFTASPSAARVGVFLNLLGFYLVEEKEITN
ncbi:MAG: hypothetical protein RSE32_13605 [Comamonas sp.]|uniref:hypothetical protein n=1 Tax=Comamonas sp. TaxID=34028 RepID=UPI002FC60AEA